MKRTTNVEAPIADNQNVMTVGPWGPMLLQDVWFLEELAHFGQEVIPGRRMHARGSGAYGTFTVTHDITRYAEANVLSRIGKERPISSAASPQWQGERGEADAERDIRGVLL